MTVKIKISEIEMCQATKIKINLECRNSKFRKKRKFKILKYLELFNFKFQR